MPIPTAVRAAFCLSLHSSYPSPLTLTIPAWTGTQFFTRLMTALACPSWTAAFGSASIFSAWPKFVQALHHVAHYLTSRRRPYRTSKASRLLSALQAASSAAWSIGYDEISCAIDESIPVASLQSANDDFVSPFTTDASKTAIANLVLNTTTNAAEIANLS